MNQVLAEPTALTHELPHEVHPSFARQPVAKLHSCGGEVDEKREEAVEGRGAF